MRVTSLTTGAERVSVNLPLTWVEAGLRLAARYQARIAGLEWSTVVALLRSEANGQAIEIEDLEHDQRVQIFID